MRSRYSFTQRLMVSWAAERPAWAARSASWSLARVALSLAFASRAFCRYSRAAASTSALFFSRALATRASALRIV